MIAGAGPAGATNRALQDPGGSRSPISRHSLAVEYRSTARRQVGRAKNPVLFSSILSAHRYGGCRSLAMMRGRSHRRRRRDIGLATGYPLEVERQLPEVLQRSGGVIRKVSVIGPFVPLCVRDRLVSARKRRLPAAYGIPRITATPTSTPRRADTPGALRQPRHVAEIDSRQACRHLHARAHPRLLGRRRSASR